MNFFKKIVYTIIFVIVFFAYTALPSYSEDFKVGYVDSQRVLDNSLMGKEIKESLDEYEQSIKKIVEIETAELRKLDEDISKQWGILTPEAQKEKMELLQRKDKEYQKKIGELQKSIQQKGAEKLGEFNREIERVVQTLGEKDGYSIIFNNIGTNIVIYARPSLNLTERIIEEMDKKMKKEDDKK